MGKLNASLLRYLEKEDLRVLTAVEMGMKNHEIVPLKLIASISGIREGATYKVLGKLTKHRLVAYETGKAYAGYRLNVLGYDHLALHSLVKQGAVYGLGSQIGVGKESDVYLVTNEAEEEMCLKLARLGRTSFRQLKNKRDYHRHRKNVSWLYLSRLAAEMEFAFMKALHDKNFPVPIPIAYSRHAVLMSVAEGYPLCQVDELGDAAALCTNLLDFIVRLASYGLIHGDFNEFNIMVADDEEDDDECEGFTAIDFPQMVSINHRNAEYYFDRDVAGIRDFFAKKFGYISTSIPSLADVKRVGHLDSELKASGYNHKVEARESSDDNDDDDDGEEDSGGEGNITDEENDHSPSDGSTIDGDDENDGDRKPVSAISEIRSIVKKQVRKQRGRQAHRVLMQSASSSTARDKKKYGRSSDLCTEDFFVTVLG